LGGVDAKWPEIGLPSSGFACITWSHYKKINF